MGKRQLPPEEPAEIHEVMLARPTTNKYILAIVVSPALFNTSDDIRRFLAMAADLKTRSRA